MTPTEKHRERAKVIYDALGRGSARDEEVIARALAKSEAEGTANLISIIADIRQKSGVGAKPMLGELADAIEARIAKAEREGMKRAAEIASLDADWSRFGKREVHEPWEGGPDDARDYRIGIVAGRAIAAAILSEAGEG